MCNNGIQTKSCFLCLQLTVDGVIGRHGQHVLRPVTRAAQRGNAPVTTQYLNMEATIVAAMVLIQRPVY